MKPSDHSLTTNRIDTPLLICWETGTQTPVPDVKSQSG